MLGFVLGGNPPRPSPPPSDRNLNALLLACAGPPLGLCPRPFPGATGRHAVPGGMPAAFAPARLDAAALVPGEVARDPVAPVNLA